MKNLTVGQRFFHFRKQWTWDCISLPQENFQGLHFCLQRGTIQKALCNKQNAKFVQSRNVAESFKNLVLLSSVGFFQGAIVLYQHNAERVAAPLGAGSHLGSPRGLARLGLSNCLRPKEQDKLAGESWGQPPAIRYHCEEGAGLRSSQERGSGAWWPWPEWNSPVTASHVHSDGTRLRSGWDISPWVGVWINGVHGPTQGRSSGGAKGKGLSWKHIPWAGTQPWPPAAMPGSSFARGKEAACSRTVAKLVPNSSNGPPGGGMLLGSLYTVEDWRHSCHLKSFSPSFLGLSQISCYLSYV